MFHLGIETSCDECSIAILKDLQILSLETFSQIALHAPFGGIVPEISSRNHLETFLPTLHAALSRAGVSWAQLEAISVTQRPGLLGSLLVGVMAAKTLSYIHGTPLVPVHHLEGHLCSIFIQEPATPLEATPIQYPLLILLVSGGHTQLRLVKSPPEMWEEDILEQSLLGESLDDAAGEAFDKTAKMLGFEYPGGKWIDLKSVGGRSDAFAFPRALKNDRSFNFSFSGLKTAVSLEIKKQQASGALSEGRIADFCASIQEAIVDALCIKVTRAIDQFQPECLALVGGVAANSRLRSRMQALGIPLVVPAPTLCTDNAAMIAAAGFFRFKQGRALSRAQALTLTARAT